MGRFCIIPVGLAGANLALLALFSQYDVRLGPFHLAAHELFKPLLFLNAAVVLAALLSPARPDETGWAPPLWLIAGVALLVYLPSVVVQGLSFSRGTLRRREP